MKEDEDDQSTGDQPITKSEMDAGNLGSSYEGDSGEPAPLQDPLTTKEMKAMRYTLNMDWEKAQKFEANQRNVKMFNLIFERIHYLTHQLLLWEEQWERDQKWQKAIEEQLNIFMNGATKILRTVSEQAQEIIDGSPESQGEMMKLIMGNLNELRDKVYSLENSLKTSEASKRICKS